ncbi:hypothetical protein [Rhodopseudomonas sp. BR0G17]|uniref:hypothetical protein n=1 Tax=Rhodopseudomonas sp. BR0G17 TaxID=2269368 RepID=UPI0013E07AD2|nr:hypothetical protein [Rhodopseudomonas sp. BR0G17]
MKDSEDLYRILIAPTDIVLTAEQIAVTAITHSETIGMSVLRQSAENAEFQKIISERTAREGREFFGIIRLKCGEVRSLASVADAPGRKAGDRHYIVLDTDMAGLPNHADIFNTVPRSDSEKPTSNKKVWRRERDKLLSLANENILRRDSFRGGQL